MDQGHGALIAAVREGRKNPREKFLLISNLDTANAYKIKLPLSDMLLQKDRCRLQEMIRGESLVLEGCVPLEIEVEPCGMRLTASNEMRPDTPCILPA